MVYSAALCRIERHDEVRNELGCNDSKQLKEIERERMLKSVDKSGKLFTVLSFFVFLIGKKTSLKFC